MWHGLAQRQGSFTNWLNFWQEVMVHCALDQQGIIGGQGNIVEEDESKFSRCKYNVDRVIYVYWVFSVICQETRSAPRLGGRSDQRPSLQLLQMMKG